MMNDLCECGDFSAYYLEKDGSINTSNKDNLNPSSFQMKHFYFMTSCNALFDYHGPNRTSEYKILPKPYSEPPPCWFEPPPCTACYHEASGMWYDHTLQDCKVVNLFHTRLEYDSSYQDHSAHHIKLYSLKTNSWKKIECKDYEYSSSQHWTQSCDRSSAACVSGTFYHAMYEAILSFDISTETFSRLPLPDGWFHKRSYILEYKGLLSALVFSDNEDSVPWKYDDHATRKYQFWIMRDGLWTRDEMVFHIPGMERPIWFSQDGMLLYFESLRHELVLFDCATGKLKYLSVNSPMRCPKMVEIFGVSCLEEDQVKQEDDEDNTLSKISLILDLDALSLESEAMMNDMVEAGMVDTTEAEVIMDNTRIEGAPPLRRNNGNQLDRNRWIGYSDEPDPEVSETKCASCLQLDICPKPKLDIFVNYCDCIPEIYFVAYSLEEDGTLSPKYFIHIPTFLSEQRYYFTTASCNGLFHFYDRISRSQALWNPTTGGYKILPKPLVELNPCIRHSLNSTGLWYDHKFEDYKVLNIVSAYIKDERGYVPDVSYHIELYSLELNSWKRIPCPDFDCGEESNGACIDGVFYCRASLKGQSGFILSFDFSTETLSSLPSPLPSLDRPDHYYFLEYKGLLSALACWFDEDNRYQDEVPLKYELWIMSNGSWTRESIFHIRGVQLPVWFSQDGKLLYLASMTDELVMFDRATGELKHLGIDWSSAGFRNTPMMIPFFESFVQLN
ncbi:uncharacterized protein LOC125223341 isoform X3 [Salvia hispanica]|uniref:uncharacterized protein LOC125223341 isoform X3 n=1 Tax=Salvia hispanica TaxID=49212 RepID=UPI0020093180|nr:uncharacterized protein LOC125223341 isoform X3 [Salvia hispanica]